MKKVIFMTLVVVLVPFFVIKFLINDNEIGYKYINENFIRVKNVENNNIYKIPFEDYIVGVLAGEMPITFEVEALKAQAVAARSYAMKQMIYNKNKEYDVENTINNQVYLSDEYLRETWKEEYPAKINKLRKVVLDTTGEYLDYQGEIAEAMFFSTSVGYTENSEEIFSYKVPYLRSVSSSWDEISPVYETKKTLQLKDFYNKLGLKYNENIKLEIVSETSTGRIKTLKINNILFDSSIVVKKLNLKSNFFNIIQNADEVIITNRGYGHGVGMSQYGAEAMAKQGYKYDEILKYYYTGTTIKKNV